MNNYSNVYKVLGARGDIPMLLLGKNTRNNRHALSRGLLDNAIFEESEEHMPNSFDGDFIFHPYINHKGIDTIVTVRCGLSIDSTSGHFHSMSIYTGEPGTNTYREILGNTNLRKRNINDQHYRWYLRQDVRIPDSDLRMPLAKFKTHMSSVSNTIKTKVEALRQVLPKLLLAWQGLWKIRRIEIPQDMMFAQCETIRQQKTFLFGRYMNGMRETKLDIERLTDNILIEYSMHITGDIT